MNKAMPNVVRLDIFSGLATVFLFGKPYDWSLGEEKRNTTIRHIKEILKRYKIPVTHLFAPNASEFNAKICVR